VQAFLAAGHVCTVMGYWEYLPISEQYQIPIVITGFEPLDIIQGILMSVKQLEEGRYEVENQYTRSVIREGNKPAQTLVEKVFCVPGNHGKISRYRPIGRDNLDLMVYDQLKFHFEQIDEINNERFHIFRSNYCLGYPKHI